MSWNYLDPLRFLMRPAAAFENKKQKQNKRRKKQNVDSSSWAAFLSFGDSAEKSLRLKSFQLIYANVLIEARVHNAPHDMFNIKCSLTG